MNKRGLSIASLVLVSAMLLSACSGIAAFSQSANPLNIAQAASQSSTVSTQSSSGTTTTTSPSSSSNTASQAPAAIAGNSELLAAYEATMESIYTTVSPQVVNIMVLVPALGNSIQNFPGFNNNNNNNQVPQYSQALGSGFFWDTNGYIVTNNHVVDGATKIEVTTSDGTTVPATIVGQDPYSDLAVIKVDLPASEIHSVTITQ
jgi:S1-C subfamily serine protease